MASRRPIPTEPDKTTDFSTERPQHANIGGSQNPLEKLTEIIPSYSARDTHPHVSRLRSNARAGADTRAARMFPNCGDRGVE